MWEWATDIKLRDAMKEEVEEAIDICKATREWPPSIAQFGDLVRKVRYERERLQDQLERSRRLPPPPSDIERRIQERAKRSKEIMANDSAVGPKAICKILMREMHESITKSR